MEWQDCITADPKVLVGKPIIKGTRLSVELVLELLASGWTHAQILDNYPTLKEGDIRACLGYARHVVHTEQFFAIDPA